MKQRIIDWWQMPDGRLSPFWCGLVAFQTGLTALLLASADPDRFWLAPPFLAMSLIWAWAGGRRQKERNE